jgi:hypothetical protein
MLACVFCIFATSAHAQDDSITTPKRITPIEGGHYRFFLKKDKGEGLPTTVTLQADGSYRVVTGSLDRFAILQMAFYEIPCTFYYGVVSRDLTLQSNARWAPSAMASISFFEVLDDGGFSELAANFSQAHAGEVAQLKDINIADDDAVASTICAPWRHYKLSREPNAATFTKQP